MQRPKEKRNQTELCGEVEQIGGLLGKKVTDQLAAHNQIDGQS